MALPLGRLPLRRTAAHHAQVKGPCIRSNTVFAWLLLLLFAEPAYCHQQALQALSRSTTTLAGINKMDKVICLGKNYLLHAQELGDAVPDRPVSPMLQGRRLVAGSVKNLAQARGQTRVLALSGFKQCHQTVKD